MAWTATDIPDQSGRTAVVTGANTGLGYETAAALAARGANVVLAVRDLEKGKAAADLIVRRYPGAEVSLQELDLTSLESVHQAADALRAGHDRIDLLINNAGVMMTPKSTTKDGFELQFGTNHLGHFALTGRLLDRLLATPGSRVVQRSAALATARAASGSTTSNPSTQLQPRCARTANRSWPTSCSPTNCSDRLAGRHDRRRRSIREARVRSWSRHLPGRSSSPSSRWSRTPRRARCRRCERRPDPGVLGGQYYGPGGFWRCGATPSSSRRAVDPTIPTSSAACGRCPRS